MSRQLPIGDVMNEAVQFALHRWLTVLRFAWLPGVVSIVLFGAFFAALFDPALFMSESPEEQAAALMAGLRMPWQTAVAIGVVLYGIVTFLFSGVAASLYRLVILGEDRPGVFHLRIDGPAFRVFLAFVIVFLISSAVSGAAMMAALAVTGQSWGDVVEGVKAFAALVEASEAGGEPDDMAVFGALAPLFQVLGAAFLFWVIPTVYFAVKLAPFPPGSAAENRLLLFGSFAMTFGHFWSILGIFILYILFIMVLSIIYGLADTILQMLAG
ncbi:MAG: hypothetical protein ACX939_14975, partial [Hyphococcus sp.]